MQCSGGFVGEHEDQRFPRLPDARTRSTPHCSNKQQGARNRAITMIVVILKHPPSLAPSPPTKQGSLTLRDLEIAQSWEAEE